MKANIAYKFELMCLPGSRSESSLKLPGVGVSCGTRR